MIRITDEVRKRAREAIELLGANTPLGVFELLQEIAKSDWQRPTPVQLAKDLFDFVNGCSHKGAQEVVNLLIRGNGREVEPHPTLQQALGSMFCAYFEAVAEMKYGDLRNQALREFAKALVDNVPENKRYFPMI